MSNAPVLDPLADARLEDLPAHSRQWYDQIREQWDREQGLMLFAYGSLMWNPGFDPTQTVVAKVRGYHRALRLRSLVNRGSAEQPGLVMTLLSGGSCRGLLYRVSPERSEATLHRLWLREMVVGTYVPRWLSCHCEDGERRALAFTLSRRSPGWVGELSDDRLLHILRHAHGRYGTTLDYLQRAVTCLREHDIRDRALERQLALARSNGL
ncbi:gamma-glutamylcyclotransferase [Roseateles amylovorans]|uniref:glutathione-specific gamma-glutamylcyclotransferase n=1 Tax=Roseateles amylovorans TaxID=2978473 RepID=A0ABY6B5L4_9BURK|nr:gamma-glutamylcyclotransferase [Roseateles amylovorans]UXH80322.1 gamma-glutamylcyclotransferase [Roseateles amylovorans]